MKKKINILLEKLEAEGFTYDFNDHLVVSADVAANYLIDLNNDFKSRTCENCVSSSLIASSIYECSKYIQQYHNDDIYQVDKDFGCNKFKRKETA